MKKRRAIPGITQRAARHSIGARFTSILSPRTLAAFITVVLWIDQRPIGAQEAPPDTAENRTLLPPSPADDPTDFQLAPLPEDASNTQPMSDPGTPALVPLSDIPESAPQRPTIKQNSPKIISDQSAPADQGLQPSPIAERVKLRPDAIDTHGFRPLASPEQQNSERFTLIQDAPGLQPSPVAQAFTDRQATLLYEAKTQIGSPGAAPKIGAPSASILEYDTPNFSFGLTGINIRAGLEFEFNDNVNAADRRLPGDQGPESDLFIRPRFGIDAFVPISHLNVLTLRLDVGYEFSLNNSRGSDASPLAISPDSELAFDVFVGNVRINIHDRFGIENQSGARSTVSNTTDYTLFTNTAGIYALWNANDLNLSTGYDYIISRFGGSSNGERDRDSHLVFGAASLLLFDLWTVGMEGNFIHSTSGKRFPTEQNSIAVGPFIRLPLTPHTSLQAAIGWQHFDQKSPRTRTTKPQSDEPRDLFADLEAEGGTDRSTDNLLYWNLSISNRLNDWFVHTLAAGQERQLGIGADSIDLKYVRYRATWLLFPQLAIQFATGLEFLKQRELGIEERATWWTIGIGAEYKLTPRLRAGARYGFTLRSSDQPFRDYEQNRVVVSLSYDF